MSKINSFEELDIWIKGMDLVKRVYEITSTNLFQKDYALKDQIRKSVISIPSNISEGFERQSNKSFVQFLYYAKGSAGELRTQLNIAFKVNYINKESYSTLKDECVYVSSSISNLIHYLQKNSNSK